MKKKIYLILVLSFNLYKANAQVPTHLWANSTGSAGYDEAKKIAIDYSGNTYITGYFTGTADFDPSVGIANLTSAGDSDIFVAKYNSSGAYQWAINVGGTGSDVALAIVIDKLNNLLITGYFKSLLIDFDPGPGTANFSPSGTDFLLQNMILRVII